MTRRTREQKCRAAGPAGGRQSNGLLRRLLYIPVFHIDANLINARQKLAAVNQLEQWFADGIILINMSGTAHSEARAGHNAQRTAKANRQIFTLTTPIEPSDPMFQKIERLLWPEGARSANERNDVEVVAEATKYAATLVTADGRSKTQPLGILGHREELARAVGVKILSPDEAVDFVREKIRDRDSFNERIIQEYGGTLPEWMGRD